jgi:hypothetical protein
MKENNLVNTNIKVTSNGSINKPKTKITDNNIAKNGIRIIKSDNGVIFKPDDEPPTECNPNNGAAFEERSNPLSSKGN